MDTVLFVNATIGFSENLFLVTFCLLTWSIGLNVTNAIII